MTQSFGFQFFCFCNNYFLYCERLCKTKQMMMDRNSGINTRAVTKAPARRADDIPRALRGRWALMRLQKPHRSRFGVPRVEGHGAPFQDTLLSWLF